MRRFEVTVISVCTVHSLYWMLIIEFDISDLLSVGLTRNKHFPLDCFFKLKT